MFFSLNFRSKKKQLILFIAIVILCIGAYMTMPIDRDIEPVFLFEGEEKKTPIYSVDTEEQKIAISFDAAWGAETLLHNKIQDCDLNHKYYL